MNLLAVVTPPPCIYQLYSTGSYKGLGGYNDTESKEENDKTQIKNGVQ